MTCPSRKKRPAAISNAPGARLEKRVDKLVARLTLAEKISQMLHNAPAIPRLGIPAFNWWNECLHGVARAGVATVFPQAIGLAAAWNTDLLNRVAGVISDEARAKHHEFLRHGIRRIFTGLAFWSPNINIFRDPRWGRGQETYGEDPYLTARLAVAFIKGLQGNHPRYLKVAATAKHFAAHSGPELERHGFNARVDERDLRETYLPAFEACVREAGVEIVMGAYNRLNGEACCASPTLLQKILRAEWNFKGHVTSDCGALDDIFRHHKIAKTAEQAAALAVKTGCDLNCGETYNALKKAVALKLVTEDEIDTALKRIFRTRFKLGMFDPHARVPYARIPFSVNDCARHRKLARQVARETIVLLKNEKRLLPLSKGIKSVAVIGPNADNRLALLGNYHGTPSSAITLLAGIRRKLAPGTAIHYAPGCALAEGVPPLTPIPACYLRPDRKGMALNGLTAAYYRQPSIKGQPAFTRIDLLVDFIWKGISPATNQMGEPFAVRWEGFLRPPVSGKYKLGVRGLTDYALSIDGKLILELKNMEYEPTTTVKDMALKAGKAYAIRLDYISRGVDPQAQLLWHMPGDDLMSEALEAARKSEVIIMALGLAPDIEGEEMPIKVPGFAGGDRTDIALPAPQEKLLRRLHALGKPMVLVLMNGSALGIPWAKKNLPAIVEGWYPGEEGGAAIADVLFGDYNPGGRLPVTFYKSVRDLPAYNNYHMAGRTYRYFRGEALFPFGFGLSYTNFRYSNLRITRQGAKRFMKITVKADVQNTGQRAGDEVVQLYIADLKAPVPGPICRLGLPRQSLGGFCRIRLAAGKKKTVTFRLSARQFSLIDNRGRRIVEPGEFEIAVGGGQPCYAKTVKGRIIIAVPAPFQL